MENYKKCPLKKRPVIINEIKEEPEDLSIKRMCKKDNLSSEAVTKRHFDLSTNSYYDCLRKTNELGFWYKSIAENFNYDQLPFTSILNNDGQVISAFKDYHDSTTATVLNQSYETLPNIHLRGLTNLEIKNFHCDSYWNPLSDQSSHHLNEISSKEYVPCNNLTPPTSPASMMSSEPQDLSIRNGELFSIESLLYNTTQNHKIHWKSTKLKSKGSNSQRARQQPVYRFQCDKCQKSYSTSTGLSKHQQLHCPAAECNRIKKEFVCKSCDKIYTSLGALKMHIRTHTLPCKCPHCGKAFSRPWLLQGHIRTHTGEKPFSCNHCQRAFADRSNLRAHQQTHVEVKKYICENCSKSFSRMSLLAKHIAGGCCGSIHMQSYI